VRGKRQAESDATWGCGCDEKNTGRMAVPARRISEGVEGGVGSAMMVIGLGIWRIHPAG